MRQPPDRREIDLTLTDYVKRLSPIAIPKDRRLQSGDLATPTEVSAFRGLAGGMQWPATQAMMHATASLSIAQSALSQLMISDLVDLNKTLRFLKETSHIGMKLTRLCCLRDVRRGAYFDAGWAARRNGESQGGCVVCAIDAENMWTSQGLTVSNRRTAIDVKLIHQRITALGEKWMWTNSAKQVADGLTKTQARQRSFSRFSSGACTRGSSAKAFRLRGSGPRPN